MKKAFSLLELIFAIVVIGIIASFAVPKYMDTRNSAMTSTIQRDIVTTTTSIQSYYLINREIEKISDAVILNKINWEGMDTKIMTFKDGGETCLTLEITDEDTILISVDSDNTKSVCKSLYELIGSSQTIDLI